MSAEAARNPSHLHIEWKSEVTEYHRLTIAFDDLPESVQRAWNNGLLGHDGRVYAAVPDEELHSFIAEKEESPYDDDVQQREITEIREADG